MIRATKTAMRMPAPPRRRGEAGELYALYVHPAWWSTGTGRALMERVLARTVRAGYQRITLWTNDVLTAARVPDPRLR